MESWRSAGGRRDCWSAGGSLRTEHKDRHTFTCRGHGELIDLMSRFKFDVRLQMETGAGAVASV